MIQGFGRKYNYRQNELLGFNKSGFPMINGQALGNVSEFRYGFCRMGFNGCEVISVYNALVYLGKNIPLHETAFFMEKYKMLFGFFGCNPLMIHRVLKHYGVPFSRPGTADYGEAFIISYWTGRKFLSSLHTVFCVADESGVKIYNRYNSCPTVKICRTAGEITGGRKPVAVYTISKENA